jgi:AraC-like DNA-binding protein
VIGKAFSTSDLPARRQFDAWVGWFDGVFDASPHSSPRAGFHARSECWQMGGCMLSRVRTPAIRVERNIMHLRRNPLDHWVIILSREATSFISSRDTTLTVPPRIAFVVSMADELISERAEDQRLQLYISRDKFADLTPVLDRARGTALNSPLGNLLGDYLVLLEQVLPTLVPDDLPRVSEAIAAMVAACLTPGQDRAGAARPQIDLIRSERLRRAVRHYLRSPSLGTRLLCQRLSMSRSQLYRLMDAEGGVARYIQRQRLLEAYALLSDQSVNRSITAIAEELCFTDTSGFSRAFRREFSASPSDVRAKSRAGPQNLSATPAQGNGAADGTLRSLLRAV